jgi:hypothetical protein
VRSAAFVISSVAVQLDALNTVAVGPEAQRSPLRRFVAVQPAARLTSPVEATSIQELLMAIA